MTLEAATLSTVPPGLDRLFLHFFDIHFLADKGRAAESKAFQDEMRLATRMAVASADKVFVPAASYFESALCREILDSLRDLVSTGLVMLCGNSTNLDEFVRERQDESFYRKDSPQYGHYRVQSKGAVTPAYLRRHQSATRDIVQHWGNKVANEHLARLLRDAVGSPIHHLETRLDRVPMELGRLAFIPDHVYEILDLNDRAILERARIRSVINEGYFRSYTQELEAGVVTDLSYLASDFRLPSFGRNLSYTQMVRFLQGRGRLKHFVECDQMELVAAGSHHEWQQALRTSVTYVGSSSSDGLIGVSATYDPRSHQMVSPHNTQIAMHPARQPNASATLTVVATLHHSVLCLAAAAVEFTAIQTKLKILFGDGKIVYLNAARSEYAIEFLDSQADTRWFLVGLSFQGQSEAANRVERLSNMLKPTLVLMVGMCMGMPKRHLPVGTVIVPNEVISFDHQRLTPGNTQYRPHGDRVDNGLYKLARVLSSEVASYRVVADKGLASASVKIEDLSADLVKTIEASFPDAAAFDMEGGGFYLAGDDKVCLWVKAVADSGELQHTTATGQAEKHATQSMVTDNATDFAVRVVRAFGAAGPATYQGVPIPIVDG